MHLGLYTIYVFYVLLSYIPAAALVTSATSSNPPVLAASVTSSSSTSSSSHTKSNSTSHAKPAGTRKPHTPSPRPIPHIRPTSHPWTPPPATTSSQSNPQPHHIKPIIIVAIVLGGLTLLAILLCLIRCGWSWHKTPRQDRITGLLNRYHLEREMEEAAVEPLRARVRKPPPPPYFPPPPEYASMMPPSPLPSSSARANDAIDPTR